VNDGASDLFGELFVVVAAGEDVLAVEGDVGGELVGGGRAAVEGLALEEAQEGVAFGEVDGLEELG